MRYKNLYEISFQIKKSGWKKYTIHIEAFNKRDAIQKAKELWYDVYDSHMFSIEARLVEAVNTAFKEATINCIDDIYRYVSENLI